MALRLITPPAIEPITLAEAKAHLRVDHSNDDTKINMLIRAARRHVDGPYGFLGRALVTQTWELVIDKFPTNELKIPLPPLQSVTSIHYDDSAGVQQLLASTEYTVDDVSEPGWVVPVTTGWPTSLFEGINAVRVQFVAGYDATSDSPPDLAGNIPDDIKAAMLLDIGNLYEHREEVIIGQTAVRLPSGAERLLRPYRVQLSMA